MRRWSLGWRKRPMMHTRVIGSIARNPRVLPPVPSTFAKPVTGSPTDLLPVDQLTTTVVRGGSRRQKSHIITQNDNHFFSSSSFFFFFFLQAM
ncbi:hypothetical protein ACOSQ4_019004 [Xanthoceras sorbifolium]